MKDIENIKLKLGSSIKDALTIIDNASLQIAIVVDGEDHLIGTLTDGDIRRGLLKGLSLESSIDSIVYKTPTIAKVSESKKNIIRLALAKNLHQIPIIDDTNRVLGVEVIHELVKPKSKPNKVVLMVGGLGARLRPLTEHTPKPMLKVGNKPILHTIVERFSEYGFINIIMCVNYKLDVIRDYFGDGSRFGVNIEYIQEAKRMGTAGALSLLKIKPNDPFFVMNGDLLTNVNFEHLKDFHLSHNAIATMCVREYDFQVPYGVVNVENEKILSIEEKPTHKFFVNAGIYMLNPEALQYIPENKLYDMPTLFEETINNGNKTISFPLREYWLDIGQIEEYNKANNDYHEIF